MQYSCRIVIAVWSFKFHYYLRHHHGGNHCVVGGVNKVMWHSLRVLAAVSRSCCSYKRHVLLLLPLLVEISFRLLWSTLSITFLMCSSEEGTDTVGMLWGKNMGLLNLLRLFVPLLHYTWPWKLQFDQPQKKDFAPSSHLVMSNFSYFRTNLHFCLVSVVVVG